MLGNTAAVWHDFAMRRTLLVLGLVAAAGGLGVMAIAAYTADREYQRLIAAGDAALATDEPSRALEAYSGAAALRPDAMLAHLKRGMAYQSRGELDNAVRDLRRAVELDPSAPRPLELLGDVNAELGRFDRAAACYERCLRLDDRSTTVLYKLGLARYRGGDAAAAIAPLEKAVSLDPRLAEPRHLLGLALREEGRLTEARTALEEAARLSPGLVAPRDALADVYFELGEERRAIDQLEAAAALEPGRPERIIALGLSLARTGQRDRAIVTLTGGLERFPGLGALYAAIGRVWLQSAEAHGDEAALGKAIAALTRAASYADASAEALTDYGRALMLSGQPSAAERVLREAVGRVPVPPRAYLHLADLDSRARRWREARDGLIRYATLVGDAEPLTSVSRRIGALSMRVRDFDLAVRWFERAMDEGGPTPSLLASLADAVARTGDLARARALMKEGLALDPFDSALLSVQASLPRQASR